MDPKFLAANGFSKENALGMYLPDSYDFFWNTTAENFQRQKCGNLTKSFGLITEEKAAELGLQPLEVMSLAAIVQRETQKIDERKRVAGVYLNRLKRK